MEQLEAPIKCGHCGNIGICKVRASYTYNIQLTPEEVHQQQIWYLFQCTACSRPILGESTIVDSEKFGKPREVFGQLCFYTGNIGNAIHPMLFDEYDLYYDADKILYPQDKTIENQWTRPDRVRRAYSSALRVQNADVRAFAIMVGRTLEEICNHENAEAKVLAEKIESLAASGRIPQILADMVTQLRLLRNLAAHANENDYEVEDEDVPIIREFIEAVLEYLYIAPEKIRSLKNKISGKKNDDDLDFLDEHPF